MICTTVTIAINHDTQPQRHCQHSPAVGRRRECVTVAFSGTRSSPLTGLRASRKAGSNKTSVVFPSVS